MACYENFKFHMISVHVNALRFGVAKIWKSSVNGLFVCYMLWACDVLNILEYMPSVKLLTINRRTGRE